MLFDQPFAGSAELQTGTVHQRMQRAGTGSPERRHLQRLRPAAQRRAVRHREVKPEQSDDGTDNPSVWRSAIPNTMPIVKAVLIASVE